MNKTLVGIAIVVAILALATFRSVKVVDAGHAAVVTRFGEVQDIVLVPGMHFVLPIDEVHPYDIRVEEETLRDVEVPSQDQLKTTVDVTVNWRIIGDALPFLKDNVGTKEEARMKLLLPNIRSVLREQGKTIEKAEDFFTERVQSRLQGDVLGTLQANLGEQGILIERVLIRNINLPPFIVQAIERKKEREQEVERQRAELERVELEAEQKVVQAKADRAAAEQEAERRRTLADAQAYEINKINEAISINEGYLNLRALETLVEMSSNPATQLYFLDRNEQMPLPLLHLNGEGEKSRVARTPPLSRN